MTLPNHAEVKPAITKNDTIPFTKELLLKWITRWAMVGWAIGWIMGFTTAWLIK